MKGQTGGYVVALTRSSYRDVGMRRSMGHARNMWPGVVVNRAGMQTGYISGGGKLMRRSNLDWMDDGACRGSGIDFFPERGADIKAAKECCKSCPVRPDCFAYVMSISPCQGIWAGTSERERRRLKRGPRVLDMPECETCGERVPRLRNRFCSNECRLGRKASA